VDAAAASPPFLAPALAPAALPLAPAPAFLAAGAAPAPALPLVAAALVVLPGMLSCWMCWMIWNDRWARLRRKVECVSVRFAFCGSSVPGSLCEFRMVFEVRWRFPGVSVARACMHMHADRRHDTPGREEGADGRRRAVGRTRNEYMCWAGGDDSGLECILAGIDLVSGRIGMIGWIHRDVCVDGWAGVSQ